MEATLERPATSEAPASPLLTVQEVAARMNVSMDTVYRLVRLGLLKKPIKLLRSSRWKASDIDDYINQQAAA